MTHVDVHLGDFRNVVSSLEDETVDCILTDPPYGETNLIWDRWPTGWPSHLRRILKRTGSMWVFGSQRMFLEHIDEFVGWAFVQDVVWEKHNGSGLFADRFRRVHELALQFRRSDSVWADVFHNPQYTLDATARSVRKKARPSHWRGQEKGGVYHTDDGGPRLMRSVIYARSEHGRAVHPTQKPLSIVEPLLRYSCPVGGLVLDPMAGSGTTGIAARSNGMASILVEGRPEFVDVIKARLAGDLPLLQGAHANAARDWAHREVAT